MFTPFAFIQPTVLAAVAPPTALNYLLIGGAFTLYNVPSLNRITKIDTNGNLIFDSSFNIGTGFSAVPFDIKQQPDGKYIVTGDFVAYSGSSINRVTRLNQNGTRDTTFNVGSGFNAVGRAIVPLSDNSNIIIGDFVTYSGSLSQRIAKVAPSGTFDTTFQTGFGFNASPFTVATQSDGKIIVAGQFSQYSQSNNFIIRTDLSGSSNTGPGTDFNIGTGFNGAPITFATQSDGRILVGGSFTSYSGSSTNTTRIIRLNVNGTQDTSFVTGTGFNGDINKILVQSDGKIVAVGGFTTYSGSTSTGIVRINTNGTRDITLNVGTGLTGVATTGIDALLQPDNKIVVGGNFTLYSGSTANRLARVNISGTLDSTFNIGTGFDNNVNALDIRPDGRILASGLFLNFSGSSRPYIVRLNDSGSYDTTLNRVGTGPNGTVLGIAHEPGTNKIVIAGNFTTYSGSSTNTTRITRLNEDGTQDTSFVTGTGLSSYNISPAHLSVKSDGKIYVCSGFTLYSGSTVNNFVRINPSGTLDTTFNGQTPSTSNDTGFNGFTRTVLTSGSNAYFGGQFIAYKPTNCMVRLNTNGTWDPTFALGAGFNNNVNAIQIQPDYKIIAVGVFTNYSGSGGPTRIIRLNPNGTRDTTFNVGSTGLNGTPLFTELQPDGKVLVAGQFTSYSGSIANRLVRINTSGTLDTTFNVGTGLNTLSSTVNVGKILVNPDNKIYFTSTDTTSYSGSSYGNLFRINSDGTLDTSFDPRAPFSYANTGNGLYATSAGGGYTIINSGSSIIVGGQFLTYKNTAVPSGTIIDSTGAISQSFNIGNGFNSTIFSFVTQSDGKILAGGAFTNYSGSNINRIVRLNTNGTIDTTFNIGTGFNTTVNNLNIQSDGKIIAIGSFISYSGSSVNGIVRINTDGTRDATFNIGNGFQTPITVNHSTLQSDGKIVVVGAFTLYSGSTNLRIVRINTDGTKDTTFNVGTGFNNTADAVLFQPDGKIIVAGQFQTYSGSSNNAITRINSNGTRDTTFNIGTGLSTLGGYALALQSDGKIVFGNASTSYSGSNAARYIIRINPSGTLDTTFNANIGGSISTISFTANALKIDGDGKIYWGNTFTTFSGSFIPNRIVRLNTNGSVDETFNQAFPNFPNGTGKGANSTINAILLL
jgi:uncharacterized delta-60 repeat protein